MKPEEFLKLQNKIGQLQQQVDRYRGMLDQLLEQLTKEFGVESLKEAESLFKKLEVAEEKAEAAYQKALQSFQQKWEDKL